MEINRSFQEIMAGFRQQPLIRDNKKSIVILGAGPAGLMRGIEAVIHGHAIEILEKRAEDAPGRLNIVALDERTIMLLQRYGVHQYLVENGLLLPPNRMDHTVVRITDLERALKIVLNELSPGAIHYNSEVEAIDDLCNLTLRGGEIKAAPDIIVNAEGVNSSTNRLLGITRTTVLPHLPMITVIFRDNRPKIVGVCTFLESAAKTAFYLFIGLYYFTIYLFKVLFQGERLNNPNRVLAASIIMNSPTQSYFGLCFTKEQSDRLTELQQAVITAPDGSQEKQAAQRELDAFVFYWSNIGFFFANALALYARIIGERSHFQNAMWVPPTAYSIANVGADRADTSYQIRGKTVILLAGDALATVDPTTGLGCNLALQTSESFVAFVEEMGIDVPLEVELNRYHFALDAVIRNAHRTSLFMREGYRPDAVDVGEKEVV